MSETLKQLFPNIRTEEAIIGEIKSDENLLLNQNTDLNLDA